MDSPPLPPVRRLAIALPDGEMSALDFGDAERPVDVVWAHGNGFNAMTHRQALAPLAGSMRILALDLRGHGATTAPADPARQTSWRVFARDIGHALSTLRGPPVVLAGHSMGATSAVLAAAAAADRVRAVVLFEPVILPRNVMWTARLPWGPQLMRRRLPIAQAAARRRAVFPDAAAATAALRGRGAFKGWPEAALADYVAGGLSPTPQGEAALVCAPAWEAANYAAQRHDAYAALRRLRAPLRVFTAEHGSTCRPAPALRVLRPDAQLHVVEGTGHLLPVLRPDVVGEALRAAVR